MLNEKQQTRGFNLHKKDLVHASECMFVIGVEIVWLIDIKFGKRLGVSKNVYYADIMVRF